MCLYICSCLRAYRGAVAHVLQLLPRARVQLRGAPGLAAPHAHPPALVARLAALPLRLAIHQVHCTNITNTSSYLCYSIVAHSSLWPACMLDLDE